MSQALALTITLTSCKDYKAPSYTNCDKRGGKSFEFMFIRRKKIVTKSPCCRQVKWRCPQRYSDLPLFADFLGWHQPFLFQILIWSFLMPLRLFFVLLLVFVLFFVLLVAKHAWPSHLRAGQCHFLLYLYLIWKMRSIKSISCLINIGRPFSEIKTNSCLINSHIGRRPLSESEVGDVASACLVLIKALTDVPSLQGYPPHPFQIAKSVQNTLKQNKH